MSGHSPSQDQDLRTALHKAVSKALHDNQFADGWPEMVDPVVDAVLALTPVQTRDNASEREGLQRALIEQLALQGFNLCPHGVEMNLERADDKTCWIDTQVIAEALASQTLSPDSTGSTGTDWREDPSADERWNAGLDYGMTQLCAVLKVDTEAVAWDAATETLDGDVRSVMHGILAIWGGDDWQNAALTPAQAPDKAGEREGLAEIATDALEILPLVAERLAEHEGDNDEVLEDLIARVRAALAHQPTGTEASRGVGAARPEYTTEVGVAADRYLKSVAFKGEYHLPDKARFCDLFAEMLDAATPTPPLSPDSTGPAGEPASVKVRDLVGVLGGLSHCHDDDAVRSIDGITYGMVRAALTPSALIAGGAIDLPKATPDQREYLARTQLATSDYDPNTIIRGHDASAPIAAPVLERLAQADAVLKEAERAVITAYNIKLRDWHRTYEMDYAARAKEKAFLEREIAIQNLVASIPAPVRDDGATVERMCRVFVGPAWEVGNVVAADYYRARMHEVLRSIPAPAGDVPGEDQTQEEWRLVETPPDNEDLVLAWSENDELFIGRKVATGWVDDHDSPCGPSHWQPLPSVPAVREGR